MFNLRDFIKKGLLDAVGKMADYQVILNATGWYEKNVLVEDDLAEINTKIEAQYIAVDEEIAGEDIIEVMPDEAVSEEDVVEVVTEETISNEEN